MTIARERLERIIRVTNWLITARRAALSLALMSCLGVAGADYQYNFKVNTPAIALGAVAFVAIVADILLARGARYLQNARPFFEERARNE